MSGLVETYIVVSLLLAVFGAVTAMGSCLVFGVGMERLRSGFEVVKKQTGYFSDAIHKLEEKTIEMDKQVEYAGAAVQKLESKVDVVDKQTAFFGNAIHQLEQKVDILQMNPAAPAEEKRSALETQIRSGQKEALISQAENLLLEAEGIGLQIKEAVPVESGARSSLSSSASASDDEELDILLDGHGGIRFH